MKAQRLPAEYQCKLKEYAEILCKGYADYDEVLNIAHELASQVKGKNKVLDKWLDVKKRLK